jgi:HlyD family secretion protein
MTATLSSTRRGIRRLDRLAIVLVGGLAAGIAAWGAFTEIEGAVVGTGSLVVDGRSKTIQHPAGGRIAEIRVRDGDTVAEGDVLLRLDDTTARAQLGVVDARLAEFRAREARLVAELTGETTLRFPATLTARADDPGVAAAMRAETALFEAGRTARAGSRIQLQERIAQTRRQIEGLEAQRTAKKAEIALTETESGAVEQLFDQRLVALSRTMALRRGVVSANGDLGRIDATIAEARSLIAETELRILQIDKDLATETARELTSVRGQIAELAERRIAAENDLSTAEIRAPRTGRVNEMKVHTVGGVVRAGDPILSIVPLDEALVAEARVAPSDIDRVHLGSTASVRLRAGNQRTLPTMPGTVARIADETSVDPRTGIAYYPVRVEFAAEATRRVAGLELVSGMPLDAFVGTGSRSPLAYLFAPLIEQIEFAWRER